MISVLVFLAMSTLLVLAVYLLSKHRRNEFIATVDLASPLPPIKLEDGHAIFVEMEEELLAEHPIVAGALNPNKFTSTIVASSLDATPVDSGSKNSWENVVREFKKNGECLNALEVCINAYPLIGALRQSCIILRAMMKQNKKSGASNEKELLLIYRACVLADFFHGSGSEVPQMSVFRLKRVERQDWEGISLSYRQIGFMYLELLSPSDIKMLIDAWGPPDSHLHARQINMNAWEAIHTASPL